MKQKYYKRQHYITIIDGVYYPSLVFAAKQLNMEHRTLTQQIERHYKISNDLFKKSIENQHISVRIFQNG